MGAVVDYSSDAPEVRSSFRPCSVGSRAQTRRIGAELPSFEAENDLQFRSVLQNPEIFMWPWGNFACEICA